MHITAQINKDNIAKSGDPDYSNYKEIIFLPNFPKILHFLFITVYKNDKPRTFSMKVLLMQASK